MKPSARGRQLTRRTRQNCLPSASGGWIDPTLPRAEKAVFSENDAQLGIAIGTPCVELAVIDPFELVTPQPISLKREYRLKQVDVLDAIELLRSQRLERQFVQFGDHREMLCNQLAT